MKKTTKTAFESEALVKTQQNAMASMDAFDMVSGGDDYFPRLQVMAVQNDNVIAGTIAGGNLGLIAGETLDDLSSSLDVLVLAWMPKALKIDGDDIIENHDVNSDVFKDIKEQSFEQDSGCMYGPEFLLYIPSVEKFATFFMSSKSARRVAPSLIKQLGKAATLSSILAKKKKYSWYAPVISECTTPFDVPEQSLIDEKVNKFLNPESTDEKDVVAKEDKPKTRSR